MSEHPWIEQIPAFVLGALEPAEEAALVEHLETCAECRTAVLEHRATAEGLAALAPTAEPPAGLRERVLAAAREEAAAEVAGAGDDERAGDDGVVSIDTARRVPGWPSLAAAAMFAVALWGVWSASRSAVERDTAFADLADARSRITALEIRGARRDSMLAVLAGPDVRTSTLTTTGADPQLRLVTNPQSALVLVTAFDLPPASAGRIYQLWGITGDDPPVSIGLFDTDASGGGIALLALPSRVFYDVGAVTEEPAGGSPQPTSQPFLVGSWGAGE